MWGVLPLRRDSFLWQDTINKYIILPELCTVFACVKYSCMSFRACRKHTKQIKVLTLTWIWTISGQLTLDGFWYSDFVILGFVLRNNELSTNSRNKQQRVNNILFLRKRVFYFASLSLWTFFSTLIGVCITENVYYF